VAGQLATWQSFAAFDGGDKGWKPTGIPMPSGLALQTADQFARPVLMNPWQDAKCCSFLLNLAWPPGGAPKFNCCVEREPAVWWRRYGVIITTALVRKDFA
jgi:hypothetical protein